MARKLRRELLLQVRRLVSPKFGGSEWQETGQNKPEHILLEELNRLDWQIQRLGQQNAGLSPGT